MIIPNLYMFDPYTLEATVVRPAQVVGDQVLTKNSFGTTTPTGVKKEGHTQIWKPSDVIDWLYKNEETSIVSSGDDGGWYYIEDHRGLEYWLPTDTYINEPSTYSKLGSLPKDIILVKPEKSLDDLKNDVKNFIESKFNEAFAKLSLGYPEAETSSWTRQEQEARSYSPNKKTNNTPYLTILSETRGISLSDLVTKIISKSDEYNTASAKLIGLRHKYLDRYNTLTDKDSVISLSNDIDFTL